MNEPEASAPSRSGQSARFHNHLHRYRNLLRKRWWVFPITMALAMGIQGFRLWTAPSAFASLGRMIMNIKITTTTTGAGFSEEFSNFLGTQTALMKSARVLDRAQERVRTAQPNLAPVRVDLQISVSPKTTIFNLQAIGAEPEYTRAYLEACMEEYINLKTEMRTSTSESTVARITEQLIALDRDLKRYEDEELAFKTNNNVVFITEQVTSIATYLVQKNRLLDSYRNESQLLSMLTLEQNLERQQNKDSLPTAGTDRESGNTPINVLNSDYLRAKQDLQLRRAELQEWSDTLRPKHPRIIALTEDIARRENLLRIFRDQGKEQLASRSDGLSLMITNLLREIKELDVRSLDLSTKLSQYDRIRANKQSVQILRDNLQRAIQSLGVEKDINPETVTTLEHASPAWPASGSIVKTLIVAAVLGLLAGGLVLGVMDRLDDRPSSFADLQDLFDEPVMGQIPLESSLRGKDGVSVLQANDSRHGFLEAYRNLRSSLLYMATQGKRPRVLLVTSAIPGDGKSMTTANLAITMALSGSRVLLVDADLRKGVLHRRFELEATPGLNEVLKRETTWNQAVRPTSTPNLSLLAHGNTAHNPGEMFLSTATLDLIKELAAQFDYVIFDSAPVMAADDVASLSPHIEGVILVIRAKQTPGRVARAALDLLYQREVNVLGLVFNGVRTDGSEYYYYRYKDYYAGQKKS